MVRRRMCPTVSLGAPTLLCGMRARLEMSFVVDGAIGATMIILWLRQRSALAPCRSNWRSLLQIPEQGVGGRARKL